MSVELSAVEEFIGIVHLVKVFSLSSMVLYVYNYILTLESEVSVMWTANLGLGKVVYFILRYCTLFSTIFINVGLFIPRLSPEMCSSPIAKQPWIPRILTLNAFAGSARNICYWVSAVIIALATDLVLQLRVYALYQHSRKILYLIVLLFCAMTASFATFLTVVLREDHEKMTYLGPGTNMYICEGSTLPAVFDKIWVAKLVNEALMFILALCKGITSLKEYEGMRSARQLMVLLVKDSVLYFLVVFAFCLMSQLVWTYAGQHYIELSTGLTLAIGSIMSQRLLVNVRRQFMKKELSSCVELSCTSTTVRWGTQYEHPSVFENTVEEERSVTMAGESVSVEGP